MRLKGGLVLREMGDEFVIVDPSQEVVDMSKVFTLNETAAFIWKKLSNIEFDVNFIVNLLIESYDVDYEQAVNDANILVLQFEEEDLIEN